MGKEKLSLSEKDKELLYNLSKGVYNKSVSKCDAIKEFSAKSQMNEKLADKYLMEYSHLRMGRKCTGVMEKHVYKYYLENIYNEFNTEALKQALKSLILCKDALPESSKKGKLNNVCEMFFLNLSKGEKTELDKEVKEEKNRKVLEKENLLHTVVEFKDKRKRESFDTLPLIAKFIIDALRSLDEDYMLLEKFELEGLLVNREEIIQIKTEGKEFKQFCLLSVFATPESEDYDNPEMYFQDEIFSFMIYDKDGNEENDVFIPECKLTKLWCNDDFDEVGPANYLWALVDVVNKVYSEELKITVE